MTTETTGQIIVGGFRIVGTFRTERDGNENHDDKR